MKAEKSYPCPQCGTPNTGTEMQIHRGLKCAQCGIGYIPVKIEPRRFREESPSLYLLLGIAAAFFLAVFAIAFIPGMFWIVVALAIVALLAGIYLKLPQK